MLKLKLIFKDRTPCVPLPDSFVFWNRLCHITAGVFCLVAIFSACLPNHEYDDLVPIEGTINSLWFGKIGKSAKSAVFSVPGIRGQFVVKVGDNVFLESKFKNGYQAKFMVGRKQLEKLDEGKRALALGISINGEKIQTIEEALEGMRISLLTAVMVSIFSILLIFSFYKIIGASRRGRAIAPKCHLA